VGAVAPAVSAKPLAPDQPPEISAAPLPQDAERRQPQPAFQPRAMEMNASLPTTGPVVGGDPGRVLLLARAKSALADLRRIERLEQYAAGELIPRTAEERRREIQVSGGRAALHGAALPLRQGTPLVRYGPTDVNRQRVPGLHGDQSVLIERTASELVDGMPLGQLSEPRPDGRIAGPRPTGASRPAS
jgi:hypothetical protein